MTTVDPQLNQIPLKLLNDPELRDYFEQLERYRHDMWVVSTGGTGESLISDAVIAEKYPWPTAQEFGEIKEFEYPVIPQEVKEFNAITLSQNYTAVDHDFINATKSITVTFPKYPNENSVIIVRNGDGSAIKLSGNGKNINGSATGRISRKTTAIEFYYFIDSDEWFAR